jgi:methylthioxylose transferase
MAPWVVAADCVALVALALTAGILISGGIRITAAGFRVSIRDPWRPALLAIAVLLVRHAIARWPPFPVAFGRAAGHGLAKLRLFDVVVICAAAADTFLLVDRAIVFGSGEGRWVYPYIEDVTASGVALAVVSALLIPAAFELTARWATRRAVLTVAVWVVIGFVFEVAVRDLYRIPIGRILESSGCTSFYTVTTLYRPLDLIQRFEQLAPSLPLHASYNMPGKTFIYYFLELFFSRPPTLALGMLALSAAGGGLVFAVAQRLFRNARVSTLAMVLSLVFPAKVAFLPLPNTIGPLWALASFWLWLVYLDNRRSLHLWLLGASLYLMMFMDPLLFVLGVVFAGMMVHRLLRRELAWSDLWRIAVVPILGFLLVHVAMRLAVGFDIVSVFVIMMRAAADFNERVGRPYGVWVVQNLKEFLLGVGVIQTLVMLLTIAALARTAWLAGRAAGLTSAVRALFDSRAAALATSVVLCLCVVDLLGVNRGEVTRLWIFLAVFIQLVCAESIITRRGEATASLTLAAVCVQTIVTVTTVGFLIC